MSQICIYVPFEEAYIREWFIHDMGGQEPVKLIRGSVESKILEVYLTKLPEDMLPDMNVEGSVAVYIPTFRNKPPDRYNYLPKHAMNYFINVVKERFDIELFNDLYRFGKITEEQKELIYAWMEKSGIDKNGTSWDTIAKRYQRQRNYYLMRLRAKKQYQRRKSKKS